MKLLIHSQTSTGALLKFGNEKVTSSNTYDGCNYLFMQELKLIYISKRGHR